MLCALGCSSSNTDVFEQRAEEQRLAELVLNSLSFPNGTKNPENSLKIAQSEGPQLVGFTTPLVVPAANEFSLQLHLGERAEQATALVIKLLGSNQLLNIPISVDSKAASLSLTGTMNAHPDIVNQRWRGQIALANKSGLMGWPMPFGIEPRDNASNAKMTITRLLGNTWETELIAYSPNGALLANAGRDLLDPSAPSWPVLRLWNTNTHQLILSAKPSEVVTAITFSQDSQWLAVGNTAGGVHMFSTTDGSASPSIAANKVEASTEEKTPSAAIKKILFLPQENTLLTGSWDHHIRAWNIETQQQLWSQKLNDRVNDMALSPDGSLLAVGVGLLTHSGAVLVRGLDGWTEHPPLSNIDFPREVTAVAFSHNGKWLAAGAGLGWTGVWAVDTGEPLVLSKNKSKTPLFRHLEATDSISGLTFAPSNSNNLVVSTRNGRILLWSMNQIGLSSWQQVDRFINDMTYSTTLERLAFTTSDGVLLEISVNDLNVAPNSIPGRKQSDSD